MNFTYISINIGKIANVISSDGSLTGGSPKKVYLTVFQLDDTMPYPGSDLPTVLGNTEFFKNNQQKFAEDLEAAKQLLGGRTFDPSSGKSKSERVSKRVDEGVPPTNYKEIVGSRSTGFGKSTTTKKQKRSSTNNQSAAEDTFDDKSEKLLSNEEISVIDQAFENTPVHKEIQRIVTAVKAEIEKSSLINTTSSTSSSSSSSSSRGGRSNPASQAAAPRMSRQAWITYIVSKMLLDEKSS